MRVSLDSFLHNLDQIVAEDPDYTLGHDGSDGKCDCIGLIIGAIRRAGGTWDGTHGSNYASRNEMEYMLPVDDPYDLSVGEIVYKVSMPGQTNYNLPSRYDNDPDRRDYYHVGVVRSVNPLRIVHCTSPKIKIDTKLGRWAYRGWLTKVEHEGGEVPMPDVKTATVVAESGSKVRMRRTPSTKDNVYWDVPVGATVTISGHQDGWSRIYYDGRLGWMMDKFLYIPGESSEAVSQPQNDGDHILLSVPLSAIEALKQAILNATGEG